ncbi:VCBS repeat-containing protein [Streptomyces shaanxiensis]|uniref:VCBS repeat-containing protein n=1 Tax=Streptomyces shaanxiensis TaxID=653357 RepID=UPI0031F0B234
MTTRSLIRTGGWRSAAVVLSALLSATLLSAAPAGAVDGAVPGDFNGDGYGDAVLPAPGAAVAGKEAAGAVVVLYGSSTGLSPTRRKTFTQNSAGVPSSPEAYDRFGGATATADLNRDGYADLVVAAPYEDTARGKDTGLLTVLWGSKGGLASATELPIPFMPGAGWAEGAAYGSDLAALSLGPGDRTEVVAAGRKLGAAHFTGPFSRTGTSGSRWITSEMETTAFTSFGLGDFNGDGKPDEAAATAHDVYIPPMKLNEMAEGDGRVVATGDVNGDGRDDVVVGDPEEPTAPASREGEIGGRVIVYYAGANGINNDVKPVVLTQNTPGVPGTSEKNDAFGASLAVADLDRDGVDDIVVGTPYEGVAGKNRSGEVTVIPGRRTGALGTGSYAFNQFTAGVGGGNELDDFFGTTVSAGDVNGDGRPELFVGASGENNFTGAVWVFPGAGTGPTAKNSRVFNAFSVNLTQQNGTLLGGNGLLWRI